MSVKLGIYVVDIRDNVYIGVGMISERNKIFMNSIKWLFFDIGYTLINEDKCHEKRIIETIKRLKEKQPELAYNDIYQAMVKASIDYRQPYPTALNILGIKEVEPYPNELEVPYESARVVLERLHKLYNIGIIANQSAGSVNRLIKYELMEHIDSVLSSTEEGLAKPNIKFFQKALSINNCNAEEAVMIGDRLDNDIFPAKKIGMKTIWIKQGFGGMQTPRSKEYEPDYTINNLDGLIEILAL